MRPLSYSDTVDTAFSTYKIDPENQGFEKAAEATRTMDLNTYNKIKELVRSIAEEAYEQFETNVYDAPLSQDQDTRGITYRGQDYFRCQGPYENTLICFVEAILKNKTVLDEKPVLEKLKKDILEIQPYLTTRYAVQRSS